MLVPSTTQTNHFLTRDQTLAWEKKDDLAWNTDTLPEVIEAVRGLFEANDDLQKVFVRSFRDASLVDVVTRQVLFN